MDRKHQHDRINVDFDRFLELLKDQEKLRALEQAGVDNWEGYSNAMEILDREFSPKVDEEEID